MGFFNKYTLTAAAAALAFSTAPATAADFGGDCCADLEERVAVLEATTARKGNRKVSLTISGQVNQAFMYWDDGVEDDVYQVNNGNSSTRFRFKGNANINHDWSAGYYIEIEQRGPMSFRVSQADDDGPNNAGVDIRQSNLYIRSKTFGTLTWGQASPSTDDLAFYGSVGGVAGHFQPDWHYGSNFKLRGNAAITTINADIFDISGSLNGTLYFDGTTRQSVIRYDTPTIAGFVLTAAWGEDDFYDVSVRYAGDWGSFKVKAAIGYSKYDADDSANTANLDEEAITASAGIIHVPTGLYVHGAYRGYEYEGAGAVPDADGYQIQVGIKNKWNTLGATAIYGAYTNVEDGFARSVIPGTDVGVAITSSEIDRWSAGITQWIDAAAMELYLVYDHTEAEINNVDTEDFDTVTVGGRIRF